MNTLDFPESHQLRKAPQLASLTLLDAALVVAQQSLLIQHPDIYVRSPERQPPEIRVATLLVERLRELHAMLALYRTTAQHAADEDIPY